MMYKSSNKSCLKRILAVFLSAVIIFSCFPNRIKAEPECPHPGVPTQFDYRRISDKEGDIETWALCQECGNWYLYCTPAGTAWRARRVKTALRM